MTVTTGFFDAVRQYSADEFARVLRALATPGVVSGIGNNLAVTAGPGLGVTVDTGFAVILGYWYYSDATQAVALLAADPSLPRIDRIILRLTISTKTVILTKLTGTPNASPVAPTLTQGSDVYEVPLAQGTVLAAATGVTSLTDQRQFAGSILSSHVHSSAGGQGGLVPHTNLTAIGTTTHADIDAHIAAGLAVHQLPANVGVLGHRAGVGRFVQSGNSAVTMGAGGAASITQLHVATTNVTFPVAFSATPAVPCPSGPTNAAVGALAVLSTTGFQFRTYDAAAGSYSESPSWIAVGT